MFSFSLRDLNDMVEVTFIGDLDIEGTELLENELIPILKEYKEVNIDFKDVAFVDSSGMGLLLTLVQTLQKKGILVTILNVRVEVMEVFDLLQIPEIVGEGVFL